MRAILGIAFSLILIVFAKPATAQHSAHQWSHRYGSTNSDISNAVAVDGSGNVYVTGSFSGTVDFGGGNLVSAGLSDIFVAMYDASGVHQWSQRFGSTGTDRGNGIAVDGSGNVVVTGFFAGTVDFGGGGLVSAGSFDIFVAEYNASGVHQWSQRFGSTALDNGRAVAVDGSGNVVVTGQFAGTVDFGGGGLVSSVGSDDIFIAKYDASGAHQWSQSFGSFGQDIGFAIAADGSGNVVMTGFFESAVNFGGGNLFSAGGDDIFLAQFDAGGAHQWSQRFGSTDDDGGRSVAVDGSGNIFVTGDFNLTVDFGGGGLVSVSGSNDIFLAKYDTSGAHQWSQRFGSPTDDFGNGVAVDGSGDVMMTGYFTGTTNFGGGGLVSSGGADIFLTKLDASGAHQWSQDFGDTNEDEGLAVAVDGSGDVIVTGRFRGAVDFGGGNLASGGSDDVFVAKYASIATAVGDTPNGSLPSLSAYPNPFNPETTIRYTVPAKGRVTLKVFDARGAQIVTLIDAEADAGAYTVAWNGHDDRGATTGSGVYFARLTSPAGVRSYKMTILK